MAYLPLPTGKRQVCFVCSSVQVALAMIISPQAIAPADTQKADRFWLWMAENTSTRFRVFRLILPLDVALDKRLDCPQHETKCVYARVRTESRTRPENQ